MRIWEGQKHADPDPELWVIDFAKNAHETNYDYLRYRILLIITLFTYENKLIFMFFGLEIVLHREEILLFQPKS